MKHAIRKNMPWPRPHPPFNKFVTGFTLFVASLSADAAIYTYAAPNYGAVTTFTSPCAGGSCSNFTLLMNGQGTFTIDPAPPPNSVNLGVLGNVTSFSFQDGLTVYGNTDPLVTLSDFRVTTNAGGDIIDFEANVSRWHTAGPHAAGDRIDSMRASSANSGGNHNLICNAIGPGDTCTATGFDGSRSTADGPGANPQLVVAPVSQVTPVPSLDSWGGGLLALTVGLSGWLAARRRGI